jgi:hypothetical protein
MFNNASGSPPELDRAELRKQPWWQLREKKQVEKKENAVLRELMGD